MNVKIDNPCTTYYSLTARGAFQQTPIAVEVEAHPSGVYYLRCVAGYEDDGRTHDWVTPNPGHPSNIPRKGGGFRKAFASHGTPFASRAALREWLARYRMVEVPGVADDPAASDRWLRENGIEPIRRIWRWES